MNQSNNNHSIRPLSLLLLSLCSLFIMVVVSSFKPKVEHLVCCTISRNQSHIYRKTQYIKKRVKIMVLPLLKLGTLALKTLSKPIAARLKKEAGLHPKFRQSIINMAQANHRFTTTIQRSIYGHATNVEIRPLNEKNAVQSAVDLLGEVFVFSVAGVALMFEVQRSSRSEAKKEELRKQELQGIRLRDEELAREVELLKQKLEELQQLARGRGLAGVFTFRNAHDAEDGKSVKPA